MPYDSCNKVRSIYDSGKYIGSYMNVLLKKLIAIMGSHDGILDRPHEI